MNILINTQSLHVNLLYNEIVKISKKKEIDKIYLLSSLMHDLDRSLFLKYSKIEKLIFIKSTTFFNDKEFKKEKFHLTNEFVNDSKFIYTDILSSYRWLPISLRNGLDITTFSMQYYFDISNYWQNFFSINKIDCVIQLNEEHSSIDSILVRSAKDANVKNIITSRIVGAYAANFEEYHAFYDNVNCEYIDLNLYKIKSGNTSKLNINSDFKSFSKKYKKNTKTKFEYIFQKLKDLISEDKSIFIKTKYLYMVFLNKIITKILLKKQYYYLKSLKKYYDSISTTEVNHNKNYVYYCFHFDPEANTLPKDNMSSNQLLNLRILSSSIPQDWVIYVKEHPHQLEYNLYNDILLNQLHSVDNFRSKSFYDYINSFENVKLVSLESNHNMLMRNSNIIASNTGTVFREANYLAKNCITFSNKSFYNNLDSVYYVNDYINCKEVISEIIKSTNRVENNIDKLFEDYSITIIDINNKSALLLNVIIENKLYSINND